MKSSEQDRNFVENEEGQAIFEFMIFLPVMLYMLVMLINVGNSINASINQQKAARGYLFYLIKGNSQGNRKTDLADFATKPLTEVSSFIIGWRARQDGTGTKSYGSAYKLPTLPWGNSTQDEDCDEKTDASEKTTQCIKVFTMVGVCGETYISNGSEFFHSSIPEFGAMKSCNFK